MWWYVTAWDTPVRSTKGNRKPSSVAFLLYGPMTNNRGEQYSEHEDQIDKAGYIVNKTYTCDLNITNASTVSSVIPILEQ